MTTTRARSRIDLARYTLGFPLLARWQPLARAAATAGLILATTGHSFGQQSQYFYDLSGNEAIQAAEAVLPPQIVGQPQSQVGEYGDVVTFSIVVADASGATFQWMFNGANIAGATGDSLVLTNVADANRGLYSVVVSNNSGVVTSTPALFALEKTWNGSVSSDWFNANNWTPAGVPGINDTVIFFGGTINLSTPVSVNGQFNWVHGTLTGSGLTVGTNGVLDITGSGALQNTLTTINGILNLRGDSTTTGSLLITPGGIVNWSGGTVNGVLNVTSNGATLNWSGGTTTGRLLVGGGAVVNWGAGTAASALTVASNALLNLIGSGQKNLYGPLTNAGTVVWGGSGNFIVEYSLCYSAFGQIENLAGGLFDIQSDAGLYNDALSFCGTPNPYFRNAGTVRKSANTGTTGISIPFYNSGTVTVLQGTFNLNGGGTIDGAFNAAAGSTINFNGGNFTYSTAPVLSGPGAIQFTGGSLTLLNNLIPNLTMVGGTLNLGTNFQGGTITNLTLAGVTLGGNYTVSGTFNCGNGFSGSLVMTNGATLNWTGGSAGSVLVGSGATANWSAGTAAGSLTIASNGLLNLIGGSQKNLYNTMTNSGTVVWGGGGDFIVRNTACDPSFGAIENQVGGLFDIQNDLGLYNTAGSTCGRSNPYFRNAGTVRKSAATGTTTFSIPFYNSGVVTVLQGTLNLNSGGTIDGAFSAAAGSTINFNGGSFTYTIAPVLTGPGAIRFTGGSLTLLNNLIPNLALVGGTLSLGTNFQGGTITNLTLTGTALSGNYTLSGTFNCGNGFSGSLVVTNGATLNWSGGSTGSLLVGSGATANWSAGTAAGSLTIASNGLLNLIGSSQKSLYNTMTNSGTVVWAGSGDFIVRNTACDPSFGAIENQAGGLFDIQNDLGLYNPAASTCGRSNPYFRNTGTVRKSAGTGTTTFSIPFINSGTLVVLQGTLALNGGFTPTGGELSSGIGGLNNFGRIAISGNATLGGTVGAVLLGGYFPVLSNAFAVVTYGSRTGIFTNLDLPSAPQWQTNYSATAFILTAIMNKLALATVLSDTNAGAILAPIIVQVQDPAGNPIATNGVVVTMALSGGSGVLSGTLAQNTDATGKAVFNDLSLNLVGPKTLTASAPGLSPASATLQIYQQVAAPRGIVAWWRAENNGLDSAGTNHGALSNGVSFVAGKVGQAFLFNAHGQMVKVKAAPGVNVGAGSGLTLEAWIKAADLVGQYPLFEWNNGSQWGAHFWINVAFSGQGGPGCLYANVMDVNRTDHYYFSPVNLVHSNVWQHVALTYDRISGISRMFLNGAPVASAALGSFTPLTTPDLYLGFRPSDSTTYAGLLDEPTMYSRALTADEITAIYTAGPAGKSLASLSLSVGLTATNTVLVSWPSSPTGFLLQENTDLRSTNWTISSATVNDDGTTKSILINPPAGARYYRLQR